MSNIDSVKDLLWPYGQEKKRGPAISRNVPSNPPRREWSLNRAFCVVLSCHPKTSVKKFDVTLCCANLF